MSDDNTGSVTPAATAASATPDTLRVPVRTTEARFDGFSVVPAGTVQHLLPHEITASMERLGAEDVLRAQLSGCVRRSVTTLSAGFLEGPSVTLDSPRRLRFNCTADLSGLLLNVYGVAEQGGRPICEMLRGGPGGGDAPFAETENEFLTISGIMASGPVTALTIDAIETEDEITAALDADSAAVQELWRNQARTPAQNRQVEQLLARRAELNGMEQRSPDEQAELDRLSADMPPLGPTPAPAPTPAPTDNDNTENSGVGTVANPGSIASPGSAVSADNPAAVGSVATLGTIGAPGGTTTNDVTKDAGALGTGTIGALGSVESVGSVGIGTVGLTGSVESIGSVGAVNSTDMSLDSTGSGATPISAGDSIGSVGSVSSGGTVESVGTVDSAGTVDSTGTVDSGASVSSIGSITTSGTAIGIPAKLDPLSDEDQELLEALRADPSPTAKQKKRLAELEARAAANPTSATEC